MADNRITALETSGRITEIRKASLPRRVLGARENLPRGGTAMKMEMTDSEAIFDHAPMLREAIFITPKTAILSTDSLPEDWDAALKAQFARQPDKIVTSIRGKPALGEDYYAVSPPTKSGAQVLAKVTRKELNQDPSRECRITLTGAAQYATEAAMRILMNAVSHLDLTEHEGPKDVPGTWRVAESEGFGYQKR